MSRGCLESGEDLSLRGAGGDDAISFPASDCFASLAMTCPGSFQTPSSAALLSCRMRRVGCASPEERRLWYPALQQ